MVREHIPLEQGLRLFLCHIVVPCTEWVREHIPLEQGLRPCLIPIFTEKLRCQRAYSIRTRIKTLMSVNAA